MKTKVMNLNQRLWAGMLFLLLSAALLAGQAQANSNDPKLVIEERYQAFLDLVENKTLVAGMPEDELYSLMEKELGPVVDFNRIALKVMGKFSRQASDQQLVVFADSFKRTLVNTYSKGLEHIDKLQKVDIDEAVLDSRGRRAKVNSVIRLSTGETYQVVYSLYLNPEKQWKVENLVVEGVNIGIVFRNQFAQYMEQHGDLEAAIANWGK